VLDIDRFRRLREQFSAAPFETLYGAWMTHGDDVLPSHQPGRARPVVRSTGRLVTEVLTFDYSQFGSLPGVA
jgi:hypothetical protein